MPVACRPSGRRVHRRVTPCGAVCAMRRAQGAVCIAVRRRVAPCAPCAVCRAPCARPCDFFPWMHPP
eukprot:gene12011-biopygen7545